MKHLKFTNKETFLVSKLLEEMKNNTEITIRIMKSGQIHIYKAEAEIRF